MMPEPMLDTRKSAHRPCWLSADNDIPCVVTSMLPFGKTQKRKIASHKYSVARLQSNSDTCDLAKSRALPLHSTTSTPEPAVKSP
jgi:hypothetical protein